MIIDRTASFFVIDGHAAERELFRIARTGGAGHFATRRLRQSARIPSLITIANQTVIFIRIDLLAELVFPITVLAYCVQLELLVGRTSALGRAALLRLVRVVAVFVLLVVVLESFDRIWRHAERLGTLDLRASDGCRQAFRFVPVPLAEYVVIVEIVVRPALAHFARIVRFYIISNRVLNAQMLAD